MRTFIGLGIFVLLGLAVKSELIRHLIGFSLALGLFLHLLFRHIDASARRSPSGLKTWR